MAVITNTWRKGKEATIETNYIEDLNVKIGFVEISCGDVNCKKYPVADL
jgi:hypothetical protein